MGWSWVFYPSNLTVTRWGEGRGSEICLPLECSEGSPEWQRLKALFSAGVVLVPQGNIGGE